MNGIAVKQKRLLERYSPRKEGDQRLSSSTIRNWVRQVKRANGNYSVLRPKSRCPSTSISNPTRPKCSLSSTSPGCPTWA
jgi:hypothetical protein